MDASLKPSVNYMVEAGTPGDWGWVAGWPRFVEGTSGHRASAAVTVVACPLRPGRVGACGGGPAGTPPAAGTVAPRRVVDVRRDSGQVREAVAAQGLHGERRRSGARPDRQVWGPTCPSVPALRPAGWSPSRCARGPLLVYHGQTAPSMPRASGLSGRACSGMAAKNTGIRARRWAPLFEVQEPAHLRHGRRELACLDFQTTLFRVHRGHPPPPR